MRWALLCAAVWSLAISQTITTKGTTYKVMEKTSLEMPCVVNDFNEEDSSVGWYKSTNLITLDEERMTDDTRYSVTKEEVGSKYNFILIISGVEPYDSGDYFCTVPGAANTTFKVVVNSPPLIGLAPEMPVYHVKVGETNIIVKCHARGNPTPKISWERQGDDMPEGIVVKGSSLIINKVDSVHSGSYSCIGKNEVGTDKRTIEIRVNEKPWVKAVYGDGFIAAKKGGDAEIVCTYDGSPDPHLEWFFNGYKINFNEDRFKNTGQTFQRENGFTKATLSLTKMTEDMFGDYQCRASNKLGSEQVAIHLSGRPGPPKLDLDQSLLSWTVRSFDDIIEYRVHLRLEKQDEWTRHVDIRVHKNDKKGIDNWSREVDLREYVEPGVKYEVQVKARNGLGWGSFAKDYITIEVSHEQKVRSSSGVLCLLSSVLGFFFVYNL